MEAENRSPPSRRAIAWAFKPFIATVLLSTIVFAREYHNRHAPKTFLAASVVIDGKEPEEGIEVSVDGLPRRFDQPIGIGSHRIEVGNPYAEPVSVKRFIWYGVNDLGRIDLRRAKLDVTLAVATRPDWIELSGSFGRRLSATGRFTNVPAGRYTATLSFDNRPVSTPVRIVRGASIVPLIAPIGGVEVTSDQSGVSFELLPHAEGDQINGVLPSKMSWVRPGNYRLIGHRGEYVRESQVTVRAGETNQFKLTFPFGALSIRSEPEGASVIIGGREQGKTPIDFSEVIPGTQLIEVSKGGFDRFSQSIEVAEGRTSTIVAHLTNTTVRELLVRAKEALDRGEYRTARSLLEDAVRADPGDASIKERLESVKPRALREEAGAFASEGKFALAVAKVDEALGILPGDRGLTELRAELLTRRESQEREAKADQERRDKELAERRRSEHLAQRKQLFEEMVAQVRNQEPHSSLLPYATWTTGTPANDIISQCQLNGAKDTPLSELVSPGLNLTSFKLGRLLPLVKWGTYVRIVACTLEEGNTVVWAMGFSYVPGPDGPTPVTKPESTAELLSRTKQYLSKLLGGDLR